MNRLLEVVRIYGIDGQVPVEAVVLFNDLPPNYTIAIPDPPAEVTLGRAILYEDKGKLHGGFRTDLDPFPSVGPGLRMHGLAASIKLRDNLIPEEIAYPFSGLQPLFFQAFRALNRFLDVYRLSKFEMNPVLTAEQDKGPWAWLDPGRPDVFTEFLASSYAVFDVDGSTLVEASLSPKMYVQTPEQCIELQEAVRRNMDRSLPLGRLLLLDAWVALYEGKIRSAITLANTALEVELRRLLIPRLEPVYAGKAKRKLDDLLRDVPFPTQLTTLLSLAGIGIILDPSTLKDCQELREKRTQVVHKGREGPDWDRTKQLLLSAEEVFRELTAAREAGEHDSL